MNEAYFEAINPAWTPCGETPVLKTYEEALADYSKAYKYWRIAIDPLNKKYRLAREVDHEEFDKIESAARIPLIEARTIFDKVGRRIRI